MESEREARNYRQLAKDYWAQARADLATATTLLDAGIYYASVFFSQQAAEMALKAALTERDERVPPGHQLVRMANSLEAPVDVMNAAAELYPDFVHTRNPDLAGGVPAQLYDRAAARMHLRLARQLLDWAKELV